jgi:hypothetical protein
MATFLLWKMKHALGGAVTVTTPPKASRMRTQTIAQAAGLHCSAASCYSPPVVVSAVASVVSGVVGVPVAVEVVEPVSGVALSPVTCVSLIVAVVAMVCLLRWENVVSKKKRQKTSDEWLLFAL